MDLKEKQRLRLAFLNELYERSQSEHDRPIDGGEIARKIGVSDMNEAYGIVKYLIGEGLAIDGNIVSPLPGCVRITHYGVKQAESANLYPDQPTNHFLPMNVLFVNNMIGSSIQQGTTNSHQSTSYSSTGGLDDVSKFIGDLENRFDQLNLSKELQLELKSEIETIKSQIRSPRPKVPIIKEILDSARTILESAAGSAVGAQLAQQIPMLLAAL